MKFILSLLLVASIFNIEAQNSKIPASFSNIKYDNEGRLTFKDGENIYYAETAPANYSITQLLGQPIGTKTGIFFDFGNFKGTITYGLIPYGKAPHPLPVFRFQLPLVDGKVAINIKDNFKYPYDFVGWSESGQCVLGYRLINETGMIVFDGEVAISGTGPFTTVPVIYEGPFVNIVTDSTAVISFNTSEPSKATVESNGLVYPSNKMTNYHEVKLINLSPDTQYDYTVDVEGFKQTYHFNTAPKSGTRKAFNFAYTSDSRHATGGGERKIYGANSYIIKKMAAVAHHEKAQFVQFTGDMINGYLTHKEEQHVQYTNWKKAVEPFWHYIPFYVGQGNHEALGPAFFNVEGKYMASIDGFPYETHSAEQAMKEAFVNPENGPISEDGSKYDPRPRKVDFPSYSENVFYYTYDNVAMIVLNSDYWYTPSLSRNTATSGGLHGYLMDNQMAWLKASILNLENDSNIDHIFVTQHTPAFPNGGHSRDDMWYSGNNDKRPYIDGKPVDKGILERRDEYLDILVNQSTKVIAILTGDEHNYNYLKITEEMPRYPENYEPEKIVLSRPIYQINNGACGAPYYAQEVLPWSAHTKSFSVENAVCIFTVDGSSIKMKVINPDTLNEIDNLELRK
ncbi:metallophosphoesterase family protein [Carboxylicivirga sp. N1Y90]|uniref:metallophosphoesterase family protein n=1 Tax=Carboxylicivirga fragile TaxID=3417571 RepID=UPI003D32ECD5|nr:metallophosphoesterase [Marinilabiliaceae bacterium N1Y90]